MSAFCPLNCASVPIDISAVSNAALVPLVMVISNFTARAMFGGAEN
ncbi:hypothetical protein [Lentzea pudingi]|nr:hypothetical protein [Lentzea pudingi]